MPDPDDLEAVRAEGRRLLARVTVAANPIAETGALARLGLFDENFAPCRFCNGEGGGMHDTLVGPQWSRCEECNGVGWTPTPHEEGADR